MKRIISMFLGISLSLLMAVNSIELSEKMNDCKNGEYNACNFIADDMLFKEKQMEANYFYSKAKAIMIEECEKNEDFNACYNLGFNFELGSPAYPKNIKKARKYYKKAIEHNKELCKRGDSDACFKLGLDYSDKGILNDNEKAEKYFSKSCQKGNEIACMKLKNL